MDVYLDNERIAVEGPTLGQIIDAARRRVEPDGRLIVEVRLDGVAAGGAELERLAERRVEAAQVQLLTADPRELALRTLEEVGEALGRARDEQQEAAELLSADEAAAAMEHIRAALEVWQQAQLAIHQVARLLDLPLDELAVDGRPLPEVIDELAELLSAAREQMTAGDWIGLADTLGYEMDRAAATWTAAAAALRGRIRGD